MMKLSLHPNRFMQKFASFALLILLIFKGFAADVNIQSVNQNGKTLYLLEIGSFSDQQSAEAIQKQVAPSVKEPILIYHPSEKDGYWLQIGPFQQQTLADDLKNKITNQLATIPTLNSEGKVWNLRNADIREVIAEVGRVTGKNFLIDPRVQGKISIVSTTPISDKELYQVFLSMLQISGFAAIPSGMITKIVPNIEAKTIAPDLLSTMKQPPKGDDMMVQVIPVKYVPADQLVPILRPLMPQWSNVSAYAPSNMLILSGRANNVKQMARIISQVDTSSANGIDLVPLRHALAMDVANTLKDLVKTQPNMGARAQPMVAADDRNNAILISGSKTDRIRLRVLISHLDRKGPFGDSSNTKVIYLNYLRAEDLVPILAGIAQASFSGNVGTTIGTITRPALDSTNPASNMVSGTPPTSNQSSPSAANYPPASNPSAVPNTTGVANQNEGGTKPSVQIIAEPNTNSIIINGPVTLIRTLQSVIGQLDIKPAQILIEALVAEVNETDFNSLGVEWGSINQESLDTATFRPGFAIINSQTKLDQFQAQIYALAEQRKANILSTPSVVVLDNRQAKILIGKQVSVATSSYPNNANATTTASPYTTFDRVNVALHLYVRPQITRGNGIQMQIDQGHDTLDPSTNLVNNTNPIFNISAIVTSVHVESGDIIVLGGLRQNSLGNDNNRIPILGDIPGLGALFQRNATNREKKVLMVFIKPLILQTERQSLQVTGSKYCQVRRDELMALQDEPYDPRNKEIVLPPLGGKIIPKPFCKTTVKVMK